MKCPKCQFENPDDAKFCIECANPMEFYCPNCGAITPATGKFCKECAFDLRKPSEPIPKELSFDEKLERIQKYLPGGLTEKILSQRGKIEGERKLVTVMFADMEGFTPLVEKLGPEEAYAIMDEVYEILIHKVLDYEGTVNEMTGDGVMALFGAPRALEDAPQRAIRSAYAIHQEMVRFSENLIKEKEYILPLKMRIGIHTGPVVVGTLGNDLRVEFKAVGDTVNLASRMEDLAERGATYVTEETYKITEGFFRYEYLGEKDIKGKQAPIKAYRVIGPSTRRTRFDVSAERGLTPFVGRQRELELLLDGFERAKQGYGQAFSIISEAGTGKSRLLYEFRKAVANEDVTFLEGKCLSYSRGVAYHPIIDIYKSNFNIKESDENDQIREKVKKDLKELGLDEFSTLPYLLELLSVKDSGFDQIPMSPEGKKNQLIETMIRIPLKASETRPLVLAFEDLHWIDKSSEEALKYVLESISGARILMLFTYRPEFIHTWGGRSYHNQINLNRLSNKESLSMTTYLLGSEDIDPVFENLILEKTEGVPFYIEQFIKSFQDLKFIDRQDGKVFLSKDIQDLTIPSTIQDVIMARVDGLPAGPKELLQAGSVIEREFPYHLIKQVINIPQEELLSHLSLLKDTELIYERGIYPASTYVFKHALTQEVVYDSILTKRKKELHHKIADAMEKTYEDRLDEHYESLAGHYITGENYEKGAKYARLTGRKLLKTGSYNDAIFWTEKQISCLEKLPQSDDMLKEIIDSRTTMGIYLIQMNYHVEAKEAVEPIYDLALKLNYNKRIPDIYIILGSYDVHVKIDFPNGIKKFKKALEIAEEENNISSFSQANYWLGLALSLECRFNESLHYIETMLQMVEEAKYVSAIAATKSIIGAFIFSMQGKLNLAYETTTEATKLAIESGDVYSKGITYINHAIVSFMKGFFDESKKLFLEGISFCEKTKHYSYIATANFFLGYLHYLLGDYTTSEYHFKNHFLIQRHHMMGLGEIGAIMSGVMNNKADIDIESIYGHGNKVTHKIFHGITNAFIADILLNIDDQHISEAEDWLQKALHFDYKNGMMCNVALDYKRFADLFKKKGDQLKAKENLSKAIDILKECGADGWVEKYEQELAELF